VQDSNACASLWCEVCPLFAFSTGQDGCPQFWTATGELLAISVLRTETGVLKHF
jgi:hypothetical protein